MHMQKVNSGIRDQLSCFSYRWTPPYERQRRDQAPAFCGTPQKLSIRMSKQSHFFAAGRQLLHQMQYLVFAASPIRVCIYLSKMHGFVLGRLVIGLLVFRLRKLTA
jgi:hypothetical protein